MDLTVALVDTGKILEEWRLHITGKATVQGACELKRVLSEALETADELILDVSGVTESDPTFFQLLCAAHQSSAALGKRLTMAPAGYRKFMQLANAAGFHPAAGGCRHNTICLLKEEVI
jgi:ABC-type transporter Mla MlaB component